MKCPDCNVELELVAVVPAWLFPLWKLCRFIIGKIEEQGEYLRNPE